jgi:hypothetical protein
VAVSRFQFTVGQLVQMVFVSGFVFWMMRTLGGTAALLVFPVIDGALRAWMGPAAGIAWSTFCRSLVLIAFGVAYYMYYEFFPAPGALELVELTFAGFSFFIIAPAASRLLRAFVNQGYQIPSSDEACGPIAWGGFGDRREPAAVSEVGVEATGEASRRCS